MSSPKLRNLEEKTMVDAPLSVTSPLLTSKIATPVALPVATCCGKGSTRDHRQGQLALVVVAGQ